MTKRFSHKENNQRGSATVEGVIAFVGFLFVIFTLLNVINYCRAQMLISSAVDTAAKELAQYSYFYKMSGLQKFNKDLSNNASVGKDNINQVIGTVDDLYKSVAKAGDDSVENVTNISNATSGGDLITTIDSTITNMQQNGANIYTSIETMENAFQGVADDPLLYMRSIVAIASQETIDLAMSKLIAAPLSKMFVQKHFGGSAQEAHEALERLGVVDGMKGLDFSESTIFANGSDEIRIIVFYKLKLVQFFDGLEMEVNMSKQASCRAWLGGDNITVSIPKIDTTVPEKPTGTTEETQNPSEPTEDTEETTEPSTEATEPPVDTEGSYWHLPTQDERYWNPQLDAFDKMLCSDKGIERETTVVNGLIYGKDDQGTVYGMTYCTSTDDLHWDAGIAYAHAAESFEDLYGEDAVTTYTYVIYVPENISEAEKEAIRKEAIADLDAYIASVKEKHGIEIPVQVEITPAGGNYDYGSEG